MTIVPFLPMDLTDLRTCTPAIMKNILLPTDLSETSMKAAAFALDLFGGEGMNYTLLNAYPKPADRYDLILVQPDLERLSRNGLRRMKRRCRKHVATVRIALVSSSDPLVQAINEIGAARPVDLVVMGTQGEGSHGQVGRNTSAVVANVDPPVIAVPAHWQPAPIARILFADDGQAINLDSMKPLLAIAQRTGAHVTILHVGSPSEDPRTTEQLRKLSTNLGEIPHSFSTEVDHDVTDAMERIMVEKDIQLVAVIRRKRSFWERMFQGSTSKRMALHTTVPLLVLRERH